MTTLPALALLSGGGLVPPGTPPAPQNHPDHLPYGPQNHNIEATISPQTTINVVDNAYYDELVTGSDTDEWSNRFNALDHTFYGNSSAVDINALGDPNEFDPNYIGPGGDIKGRGYVAVSDASVTVHFVRQAAVLNAPVYPVFCNDRYEVSDNQPHTGSSIPFGWQLWDSNRVNLIFAVSVSHKTGGSEE